MKRFPVRAAVVAAALLVLPFVLVSPSAASARASLRLALDGTFTVSRQPVTIPGRTFAVSGTVRPYVPGQRVIVREYLNGREVFARAMALRRSPGGTFALFEKRLSAPAAGTVLVAVEHRGSSRLPALRTRISFAALDTNVGFGSTGRMVELIQQRLQALHFYLPTSGVYDSYTGLAVDAYHRLLRRGSSQQLDASTLTWLLNGWGAFPLRSAHQGRHAEGDLTLQLLALADNGQVQLIFPISSGKPSTPTILGSFRVYRRTPGYLPDGMYYSSFFTGGYAIHGYDPAPDYPASHGCLRLPIQDAIAAYDWLAMGDWVDTYW
jgi:hypothetical protein